MDNRFKDAEHLIRLAGALFICVVLFLVIRAAVVPKGFGQYGHYRPQALEENMARPIAFAGQADCVLCHEAEDKDRQGGKHAKIACEACHGPQAVHANAADPGTAKPKLPAVVALCANCHEKSAAKPAWFPQVVITEHNADAGACNNCHQPHKPGQ